MIKKILLCLSIYCCNEHAFSQNLYEKGNHYLDVNIAFGGNKVYTQLSDELNKTNSINISLPALTYEYGLLNEIGVGMQVQDNHYFSKKIPTYLSSTTFLINNNLHYIKKENFDFIVGIGYGLGIYKAKDREFKYISNGSGFAYNIYIASRFILSEKLTINAKMLWNDESYKMTHLNFNTIEYQLNKNSDYYTYLKGIHLSFGITFNLKKALLRGIKQK